MLHENNVTWEQCSMEQCYTEMLYGNNVPWNNVTWEQCYIKTVTRNNVTWECYREQCYMGIILQSNNVT